MDEGEAIHRLIDKIESALPEIKNRSITSLHTKVTVGIVDYQQLPKFKKMPGVLLGWINENSNRSENLYKVLTILSYFAKSEDGLVLLEQYEATQFFRQLRQYLLSQNSKQDQYTNILEVMIKALLPLHPQTIAPSEMEASNIPEQQSKVGQQRQKDQSKVQPANKVQSQKQIVLSWIVSKDPLGKKEQDELYSLFMELRHGKRQLQLQWLKRIHDLIKYWGYKWFRFKNDLVNELMDQLPKNKLNWLIIEIIRSVLRGLNQNSQQLKSGELDLININYPKPVVRPDCEAVNISIRSEIFESIYSSYLLQDILSYEFEQKKQASLEQWIVGLNFSFSPNYFLLALQRLLKRQKRDLNLTAINRQISYYCQHYPQSRMSISLIVENIPQNWNLVPEDFPALIGYLQEAEKGKAYAYLSKYDNQWQLGCNLHLIAEVMNNLEKGIAGIDHKNKRNQLITLYIRCLLTLGVAVEKQDPLMSYYPKMRSLITQIAQNPTLRTFFFQEVLLSINSHNYVKYGSKSYICSELALMIFSEDSLFPKLFQQALNDDQSLACWLQIAKRLILTNSFSEIDNYSVILYCLTYHKNQQIKEISKYLLEKVGKSGKIKALLCRLFSISEEERRKITSELFNDHGPIIFQQLDGQPPPKLMGSKKLLKIGAETIQNYIKIIFSSNLEEHIQLSAAEQLLQSIQRMELNEELIDILVDLSSSIRNLLNSQVLSLPRTLVSKLIQIRQILHFRTQQENTLLLPKLVQLLDRQSQPKVIKILLRQIYTICFQNPFKKNKQMHFSCLLYSHLKTVGMPCPQRPENQQETTTISANTTKQSLLPNYKETKQFEHLASWLIQQIINHDKIVLDDVVAEMVEKEIGQIMHASKGYTQLHFLNFVFQTIKQHKIDIPDKINDYSAPLLNTLLAKDMAPFNSEVTAQLLQIIGNRRNRQLNNLLINGSPGTWKLFLLSPQTAISTTVIQNLLKSLLGLHYGREAALTLKVLLHHIKNEQLNKFSQSLILSSCLKYFRQEGDYSLRKIALCVLTEIYGTNNLPVDGQSQLFASLTSVITEQQLPSDLMTLTINLAKKIVSKDSKIIEQGTVLKLLLSRLMAIASCTGVYALLRASVLELFRVVVSLGRQDLLSGGDLIDISFPLLGTLQKDVLLKEEDLRLLIAAFDILYFSCENQADLPKYILTSTRLQSQLLSAFSVKMKGQSKKDLLQSASRLWLKLSITEEDLFIYKLTQLLTSYSTSLMEILSIYLQEGGVQYQKMLGWTVLIWSKNREPLNEELGGLLSSTILSGSKPELIKMVLPFSLKAKQLFLSSSLLTTSIREAISIIDGRIVKDSKQKKKKIKIYVLTEKENEILQNLFGYLSSLFYWSGDGQVEVGEGLRKVVTFLQKFYLAGNWEETIMKHFLRVTTNMALGSALSENVATCLSQSLSFVEEIATCITKAETLDESSKLALRLAASLANMQSVRAQLLRARVIEEICSRLIKSEQKDELNLEYATYAVELLMAFSAYKDSNTRILNDKRLADIFVRLLRAGKFSILQQKIAKLLANLACFKHNKPTLMSCKDLHKTILGLLEDHSVSYRPSLLFLLYNLLYKNSAALKLYRRPEVIQLITSVQRAVGEPVNEIIHCLLQVLEGDEG